MLRSASLRYAVRTVRHTLGEQLGASPLVLRVSEYYLFQVVHNGERNGECHQKCPLIFFILFEYIGYVYVY